VTSNDADDRAPDARQGGLLAWHAEDGPSTLGDSEIHSVPTDGITPILLSLFSAEASMERVRLVWYAFQEPPLVAKVQRRTANDEWREIGVVVGDGTGRMSFEDRSVTPGARYGYRLAVTENGTERFHAETWVEVPVRLVFAIRPVRPNPVVGDLVVDFTLAEAGPVRLELLDVAGRQVRSWSIAGLTPGSHTRRLGAATGLAPAVYFLRLTQGRASATRRVIVIS